MGKSCPIQKNEKLITLATSTCIFAFTLAGGAAEKWVSMSGVEIGLWKGITFSNTSPIGPMFDGIEVCRGTAMITVLLTFAHFLMSVYQFINKSKTLDGSGWMQHNLDFGSLFLSGTITAFALFTSAIYTSFTSGTTVSMGASLSLFWTSFVFALLQTAMLGYTWKCAGKETGRVDINENDENQDRGNWDSHTEYLLSMVGYAVGLGNVWRFPYLCFKYGGGGFLIPYFTMLILVGLPVFFMECAIGQFDSRGPIESWNISPAFRGIGWMMVLYSAFVGIYYNVIIAYSVYYFFASLDINQYWQSCDNFWNTANCYTLENKAANANVDFTGKTLASEEYWNNHILKYSEMDAAGGHSIVWQIVVVLLTAWTVVFFSLMKGIKSSGKVVWFTAIFPYVVILILVIRGCTLEGAKAGIDYYIGSQSDLSHLKNGEVWRVAASQIFFSLSAGWGGVQALSSYNNFKNNCFKDSLIVAWANCLTSVFAGFAIFSVLGHLATVLGVTVPEVTKSSFGLAFIAYPVALAKIPGAAFWSCLFFLMLFTLGLDSQFTILETVATSLCDFSPYFRKRRVATMGILSTGMFLVALLCCTKTGVNWVDMIDTYVSGWAILMSTVFEVIVLGTVYGGGLPAWLFGHGDERLVEDIELMIGKKSKAWWFFWKIMWYFITPVVMIALLVWGWVEYSEPAFPDWANAIGWVVVCSGLVGLLVYPVIELMAARKEGKPWCSIFKPNNKWGPYLTKYHTGRYEGIDKQD